MGLVGSNFKIKTINWNLESRRRKEKKLQDAIDDLKKQIDGEVDKKKKLDKDKEGANSQIMKLKADLDQNNQKTDQIQEQMDLLKKKN